MENRFGIKDFFLFALIVVVLATVVLGMIQFDRQWDLVQKIDEQNQLLADDLNRLNRKIDRGVMVAGASGGGGAAMGSAETNPFFHLEQVEENDDFSRGGTYVDNFGTKIGRLTPLVSSDVYQTWIEYLVMEGLAQRDPYTLEWVPKIAESWEESEDGLTFTFKLRENATFSDGSPVTADDVVYTFDWIRNPEVQAQRAASYLTKLDSVKALDERTVEFKFNEPYFLNFETIVGISIMSRKFYEGYSPVDYNESVSLLFGSGPYVLEAGTNWSPEDAVILARNPRYWGTPPTFDRLVFRQIQEDAASSVMFRNQELDVLRTTPDQYDALSKDPAILEIAEPVAYDTPFGGYTYIGWNQQKLIDGREQSTIFADAKVRRAMTMLIDRQRLADEIYFGYAAPADGPFAPTSPQSDPSIEPLPYDVAGAVALLKEAGWEDRDGNGILENADGTELRFKLMYPGSSDVSEKIALFLKDAFAAGNVLMEPDRTDWPVLVDKLNKSDFEACTLGWSSVPESDPYQIFHSDNAKTGGDNRTGYRSERLDEAIDAARVTMDKEERMKKWHTVHQILHEDQPYTFLLNRKALRLFNNRLKNIEETPLGLNYEFLNGGVLPWYAAKGSAQPTE